MRTLTHTPIHPPFTLTSSESESSSAGSSCSSAASSGSSSSLTCFVAVFVRAWACMCMRVFVRACALCVHGCACMHACARCACACRRVSFVCLSTVCPCVSMQVGFVSGVPGRSTPVARIPRCRCCHTPQAPRRSCHESFRCQRSQRKSLSSDRLVSHSVPPAALQPRPAPKTDPSGAPPQHSHNSTLLPARPCSPNCLPTAFVRIRSYPDYHCVLSSTKTRCSEHACRVLVVDVG